MNLCTTSCCISLTVLILATSASSVAQEGSTGNAESYLAIIFYSIGQADVVAQLEDTGLSPMDIEKTVVDVMDGTAQCAITAMFEKNDPVSNQILAALDRGVSPDEFDTELEGVAKAEVDAWSDELPMLM